MKKSKHWWTVVNSDETYSSFEAADKAADHLLDLGYYVLVEEWKLDRDGSEVRVS
jgi:hypothetical protein